MTASYAVCDVFDGLASLETGSVDLVVTSPPFLALRSYLPADHPDKGKEIGSEATPAEFLDVMLRFTAELRRVVAPHGSIAVELGDTYAGNQPDREKYITGEWSMGPTTDMNSKSDDMARLVRRSASGSGTMNQRAGDGWPLAKSKTLIPELYRIALAYGVNPLTGEPSPAGRWRVRNVVTWCRPNPPVGALGDKWRPATSDVVVACVSGKRFWDDLATRKPHKADPTTYTGNGYSKGFPEGIEGNESMPGNPSGAPLLDYWEVPLDGSEPTPYGPKEKPKADPKVGEQDRSDPKHLNHGGHMGTSEAGAPLLDYWEIPLDGSEPTPYGPKEKDAQRSHMGGKPKGRREDTGTDSIPTYRPNYEDRPLNEHGAPLLDYWEIPPGGYKGSHYAVFPPELVVPLVKAMCPERVCVECGEPSRRIVGDVAYEPHPSGGSAVRNAVYGREKLPKLMRVSVESEFTDCGHDAWRPGVVLDPFAGSGTTLAVATGHGFDAIGFDLDPRNLELARQRVGMFLEERVVLENVRRGEAHQKIAGDTP